MNDLWAALAIALILEGAMPFLSPKLWKETLNKLNLLAEPKIRLVGFSVMLSGLLLLTFVRNNQ